MQDGKILSQQQTLGYDAVKDFLKGKQLAFRKGDKKGLQAGQREIDKKLRETTLQG